MNLKHSTGQTGSSATPSASEYVPEMVPIPTPATQPHRHIDFLTALFTFWLRPKQLGPHLTTDPFRRALAAHVISAAAVALILLLGFAWHDHASDSAMRDQVLHVRVAHCILSLADESANFLHSVSGPDSIWTQKWPSWLFGAFGIEFVLVLLGTLFMPLAAAGDRPSSVWTRSIKLVYWCTTFAAPIAMAWAILYNAADWDFYNPLLYYIPCESYGEWGAFFLIGGALLMISFFVLLVRALYVGSQRCVGQAVRPIATQRPAQCDECGYPLRGLPLDTKCPECGLPVRDSLVGGRRRPTAWEREGLKRLGVFELIRMQWSAIGGTAMFRNVPVYRGVSTSRGFWWITWLLMAITLIALLHTIATFTPLSSELRGFAGPLSLTFALAPWMLQTFMMFAACQYGRIHHGMRDYRVSSIVSYYASPAMWPLLMVAFALTILSYETFGPFVQANRNYIQTAGGLLAIGGLVFWWLRIRQGLNRVQYASE